MAWADRLPVKPWHLIFLPERGGGKPDSMHAERVDGYNPLAVADAIKRKKAFWSRETVRCCLKQSLTDIPVTLHPMHLLTGLKEEIEAWQAIDPLEAYAKEIIDAGLVTEEQIDQRKTQTTKAMTQACRLASSLEISPRLPSEKIAGLMFSKRKVENYDPSRTPNLFCLRQKTQGSGLW